MQRIYEYKQLKYKCTDALRNTSVLVKCRLKRLISQNLTNIRPCLQTRSSKTLFNKILGRVLLSKQKTNLFKHLRSFKILKKKTSRSSVESLKSSVECVKSSAECLCYNNALYTHDTNQHFNHLEINWLYLSRIFCKVNFK